MLCKCGVTGSTGVAMVWPSSKTSLSERSTKLDSSKYSFSSRVSESESLPGLPAFLSAILILGCWSPVVGWLLRGKRVGVGGKGA